MTAFGQQVHRNRMDVSTQLPHFRSTPIVGQHQIHLTSHAPEKVIRNDTEKSRDGLIYQTMTGGRGSMPKQQRLKREAAVAHGNTQYIPSQILQPNPTDEWEGEGEGEGGSSSGVIPGSRSDTLLVEKGKVDDDSKGAGVCCPKCPTCPKKIMGDAGK